MGGGASWKAIGLLTLHVAVLLVGVLAQTDLGPAAVRPWVPWMWLLLAVAGGVLWWLDRSVLGATPPETTPATQPSPLRRRRLAGGGGALLFAAGMLDVASDPSSRSGMILWLAGLALMTFAACGRVRPPAGAPRRRLDLAIAALLAILALAPRLYDLEGIPADVNNDEGEHADSGLNLVDRLPLFPGDPNEPLSPFQTGWQTEPTGGHFLLGAVMQVAGESVFGLRLTAALSGMAAVCLLYGFLRDEVRPSAALAAALLWSASHVHLFWSRGGFLQATTTAATVAALWMLARGLRTGARAPFVLFGLILGLAQYLYWSARFLLVVLLLHGLYLLIAQPSLLRRRLAGFAWAALFFAFAVAPSAFWFVAHADTLFVRGRQVSALQNEAYRDGAYPGASAAGVVLGQLKRSLEGFALKGDGSRAFYRAAAPLLDPVTSTLCLLGILGLTLSLRDPTRMLVSLWLWAPILTLCALTVDPPPTQRLLFVFPAICFVAGVTIERLVGLAALAGRGARLACAGLLLALVGYGLYWNGHVFFVQFPPTTIAKHWTVAGRLAQAHAATDMVYAVSPPHLWAFNSVIRFLARGVPAANADVAHLPVQERGRRDGLFLVSTRLPDAMARLRQTYPSGASEEHWAANGELLFSAFRVPARDLNRAAGRDAPWITSDLRFGLGGRTFGRLHQPRAIAVGDDGAVYVADPGRGHIVAFDAGGKPAADIGPPPAISDDAVWQVWSIAIADDGTLLALDRSRRTIDRFSPSGAWLGEITATRLEDPVALAVAPDGSILVAAGVSRVVARLRPEGTPRFWRPDAATVSELVSIAVDADGSIYAGDAAGRVHHLSADLEPINTWSLPLDPKKRLELAAAPVAGAVYAVHPGRGPIHLYDAAGHHLHSFGKEGIEPGELRITAAVAVDRTGRVYALDREGRRVVRFLPPLE